MHVFKRQQRKARLQAQQQQERTSVRAWASVGMRLTFRAEVMPGRERDGRTFIVSAVLANGRVELSGMFGQHAETEFEPVP
jgi:hypothetical protein